jgi:hypothetical protein
MKKWTNEELQFLRDNLGKLTYREIGNTLGRSMGSVKRKCESLRGIGKPTLTKVAYRAMLRRCYYEKDPSYSHYGSRGITVCDRWLGVDGYSHFVEDMGEKPSAEMRLDRIDNDCGYYKENCRWVTAKESANNRTNSKWVYAFGEWRTIAQWLNDDRCKVSESVLRSRLDKGESPEDIMSNAQEIYSRIPSHKGIIDWDTINLETLNASDLSKHPLCTVSSDTIKTRIRAGWTKKDATLLPTGTRQQPHLKRYGGFGESKTVSEWAKDERCNVGASELLRRIKRGMEFEKALTERNRSKESNPYIKKGVGRQVEWNGEKKNLKEWASDPRCKCSYESLKNRTNRLGWDFDKAMNTP